MVRYSFVVDLRDPKVRRTVESVEQNLGDDLLTMEMVALPLGVTEVSYILSSERLQLRDIFLSTILTELTFSLEGVEPNLIQLYFLSETIKLAVKAELGIEIDIEQVHYDELLRFTLRQNGFPIYVSEEESLTLRSQYPLNQLLDCAPISDCWCTERAAKELQLANYELKKFGRLFVFAMSPDISQDEVLEDLAAIRDTIDRMITEGHESVSDAIVEEIGTIWGLPVDSHSILVPKEHPLKLHIEHSLLSVAMDGLPRIEIPVMFQVTGEEDLARLTFAATLAYISLAEIHTPLKEFVDQVLVTPLPSVVVSLFNYEQQEELANLLSLKLTEARSWQVFRETNLEAATIRRHLLHRAIPQVIAMVVKVGGSEFTVANSVDPLNSVATGDDERLRQELVAYYQKVCHDEMDAVTYQQISEMSISELTRLVVTDDRPRYCFGYETASELPSAVNPVTQVPFSQKTKLRITQSDAVARGLYGVGDILPGLISIPETVMVSPPGTVNFFTVADEIMRYNVTGISVDFGENEEDLFDLSLNRDLTDSDKDTITRAWKSGTLLNPWAKSMLIERNSMSRHGLQLDPILQDASDSSITGDRALSFLKHVT